MRTAVLVLSTLLVAGCSLGPAAPRLESGQTQCTEFDGSNFNFVPCPGSPAGQDAALARGIARKYTDNGDGTITDERTGLMWEKLDDNNTGGIHDIDNDYIWQSAFTGKIADLNSAGFAGYDDWRLPNIEELQTLVDYGRIHPAVDLVFNTACTPGCTITSCSCTKDIAGPFAGSEYWSSTTVLKPDSGKPAAWCMRTKDGMSKICDKTAMKARVRAVRGGF